MKSHWAHRRAVRRIAAGSTKDDRKHDQLSQAGTTTHARDSGSGRENAGLASLSCAQLSSLSATRRAGLLAVAAALIPMAGVLNAVSGVQPALADPLCSGGTCTVSFTTPGPGQFTVPDGVTSLSVTLYGGTGGTNNLGEVPGGDGAEVNATLTVSPDQVLGVDVGGGGESGGVDGGGSGANGGGGGGGATDVTSGGSIQLVAGGGGGAGGDEDYIDSCLGVNVTPAGGAGGNAGTGGGSGQSFASGGITLAGGAGGAAGTTSGSGGSGGSAAGSDSCPDATLVDGQAGGDGTGTFFTIGHGGSAYSGADFTGGGGGGGGYVGGGAGGDGAWYADVPAQGFGCGSYGNPCPPEYITAGAGGGGGGSSAAPGNSVLFAVVDYSGNSGQVNGGNGEAVFSYPDPVASPSITGTPSPTSVTLSSSPPPTLTDSAVVSGGNAPTGTITFTLYDSSNSLVDTETASVNGNGTYTTPTGYTLPSTGTITGTYQWDVSYSGDSDNAGASDNNDPAEVLAVSDASPSITGTPSPTSVTLSSSPPPTLTDSVVLSGGAAPTGTITFSLYDPSNSLVDTETAAVSGNGTYTTPTGYTLPSTGTITGTYQWDVSYSGDSDNTGASDNNDPADVVTVSRDATSFNITVQRGPMGSTTYGLPSTLGWTGLPSGATGTVTFYTAANVELCSLSLAATSCATSTSLGVGSYPGIYATYGGDGNFNGSTSTNTVTLTVYKANQTIHFTLKAPTTATFGGPKYTPKATTTSFLPVSFKIVAASVKVCSMSGGKVSFIGLGTCTIDANQAGDADYNPTSTLQSFKVGKAPTKITTAPATVTHSVKTTYVAMTATLRSLASGATIGGQKITFTLFADGWSVTGTAITNRSGVATFKVSFSKPDAARSYSASFGGSKDYNPSGATQSI